MPLFEKDLLQKVLAGEKTQTRRIHRQEWKVGKKYGVRDRWFSKPQGYIVILRKWRQRLGDISVKDAEKEGFKSIEEFQSAWTKIYGSFDVEQVVVAYEFRRAQPSIVLIFNDSTGFMDLCFLHSNRLYMGYG